MKITATNNKIVINISALDRFQRKRFLSGIGMVMFEHWNSENEPVYNLELFSEDTNERALNAIIYSIPYELKGNIEIDDRARKIFAEYEQKRTKREEQRKATENAIMAKKTAIMRVQSGCGWCPSLKLDENGRWYTCQATGERCKKNATEQEWLFEKWKETGKFERSTPFPVKDCPYLEVLR